MVYAIVVCKKCRKDIKLGKERFFDKKYLCEDCYKKARNLPVDAEEESVTPIEEKTVEKKILPEDDKDDRRYSPVDPDDL